MYNPAMFIMSLTHNCSQFNCYNFCGDANASAEKKLRNAFEQGWLALGKKEEWGEGGGRGGGGRGGGEGK